ncbi:MAG: nucleoside transporter C-terminal domain-containing protein [Bacteroidota bacterium]
MNQIYTRLAATLLSLFFCASFAQAKDFSEDNLDYNWRILTLQQGENLQSFDRKTRNRFMLDKAGNVQITLDSTIRKGTYQLSGNTITFFFELVALESEVDSVAYQADVDGGEVTFFKEKEKVASLADGALESLRKQEVYQLAWTEQGTLLLTSDKGAYELGKNTLVDKGFSIWDVLRGILGILVLLAIAWAFSTNRKAIDWKLVGTGIGLQLIVAVLVLKVDQVGDAIKVASEGMVTLLSFSDIGAEYMFGPLADGTSFGIIFAFRILPTIVFFSALMSMLYYLGVLQKIVYAFAWVMSKTMRLSGAESLAAAGNIFVGQTEAPLLVKPYLERMTRSEIMALMTGGFATIAGGVFAAYVLFLGGGDPAQAAEFAKHLITASVMSAPAALVLAKILVPETEEIATDLTVPKEKIGTNILDALSNGITDGLKLAVNVGVMLMVFTAVMALLNSFFGDVLGEWTGLNDLVNEWTDGKFKSFDLQFLFGLVGAPFAWLMGVPTEDILIIGQLLGEKTVLNEFYAYATLGEQIGNSEIINKKSVVIATYALCGFANFASIGIQIGGIGSLAPSQRKNLSELSMRALLGGTFAAFLTACIAGMLIFV